ncbi:hypothetical protein DFP73DRAFT_536529 [Morchella snyderi]|nr:hypothetical protein DFP73DRAFT_536529 [Morchella snyderi]
MCILAYRYMKCVLIATALLYYRAPLSYSTHNSTHNSTHTLPILYPTHSGSLNAPPPNKHWVKYQTEPHARADTVSSFGGAAAGVSTLTYVHVGYM